jgi:single-strand DNA-binding protein
MISTSGVGRLTQDPEMRTTPSGKSVAKLRIASDRRDRNAQPVYVDVIAWNGLAETVAQHLNKGRQIYVSGRLDYQEWSGESGKRSRHQIVAEEIEFLDRPRSEEPAPANEEPDHDEAQEPAAS